jgi:acid phosphatase type 7
MLESMEPLFVKYHVNLVLSGHDHAFLRTHPMVGGKLDLSGKGPVYLTLGAGGNREGHPEGYINDVPESWVAKRDNYEYGYGNLFVANATHAHFTWVRDGTTTQGVQDDVWFMNQLLVEPTSATES